MNTPNARRVLLGLAFGVLIALLLAPQTRWLVRPQIVPGPRSDAQAVARFVAAHADDYLVQLGGQPTLEGARRLVPRFPNTPSLRANLLRYATQNLHLHRADSDGALLQGKPASMRPSPTDNPPPTPAQLAAFDADAEAGERLDPDNAYFPFMRSVGLFAAHRDAEGLAAVTRAGTKTVWREYYEDEVEGRWRIGDGVVGHREALGSMGVSASVLFPQYQLVRAVARLVAARAVEEELAGHREAGLVLRRSLARCGDLMRADSHSYIGNLVGIAINSISRTRPGGAAPITTEAGASASPEINRQLAQKKLDAYCDSVTGLGHPDAAQEARAQASAAEQVRHITPGLETFVFGLRFAQITRLIFSCIAGWVLAVGFGLLLLLGLAAWGASVLPHVKARLPLPAGAVWGVWAMLLLAAAGTAGFIETATSSAIFAVALLSPIPLAALSLLSLFRPDFRRPFGQAALAGLVTVVAVGVFFGLAAWQVQGAYDLLATLRQTSLLPGSDGAPESHLTERVQILVGVAFVITLPLLLALVFSIAARLKRIPASVGMVEGFRAWTPLTLCLLAVLYGGLTLWTVRQEDAVNYGLEQSLHGEAQYLAQLTGQSWPGPVR